MYIYIYIYTYMYMYVCTYREREKRKRAKRYHLLITIYKTKYTRKKKMTGRPGKMK